jgi:TolB-like protein
MKYRFATCCLDTDRHVFERDGKVLHLQPQVFDLLVCLTRADGQLITHETLVKDVWHGLHVSDAAISARINAARRAVGDDGKAQQIIETVARRGFRLAAPVTVEMGSPPADQDQAKPTLSSMRLPALAVLPFRYQARDPLDTLADGIVDEVTSALSRVGEFHVIARQSAVTLSNNPDIRAITQVLGADYLVEGSIQRVGDRVRIGAHLVDVQGHTIWSARYDESLDDLFELQDRIALQVAGQLPVKLRGAEIVRANSLVDGAGQARAWVLRALPHFWAHQRAENDHAIQLLSGALDVDRYDVRALAYKAWAIAQRPVYLWSEDAQADRDEALALAYRAAPRAHNDPSSLVAISAAFALTLSDPSPALAFAQRAVGIDPSNAWGRMRLGWALNYSGRPAEALPEFSQAQRLSPLDPLLYNMRIGAAVSHVGLGNFDLAIATIHDVIANTPQVSWAYRILASIYRRLGDLSGEARATQKLVEANPGLTMKQLETALPPGLVQQTSTYIPWQLLEDDLDYGQDL